MVDGTYNAKKENFDKWHESSFEPNKFIGFIRNQYAWHGVNTIHCPSNYSRKALLIVVCIPKSENRIIMIIKRIHDRIMNRIVRFVHKIN